VMTLLAAEYRAKADKTKPKRACRILNTMGFRAEESPGRKKRCATPISIDKKASNGRREVTVWYPIHDWTEDAVWARIRASGAPYHHAYDLGMRRLSCCFCIFAPEHALMIAGHHNRELLSEYVRIEKKIGHAFRGSKTKKFHLAVIQDRLVAGEVPVATQAADDGCWGM
jgi:3'-phosphoadenosine 5'-phosphosulfate sulfotransferase (PAPS reductase)/FAD synthetase